MTRWTPHGLWRLTGRLLAVARSSRRPRAEVPTEIVGEKSPDRTCCAADVAAAKGCCADPPPAGPRPCRTPTGDVPTSRTGRAETAWRIDTDMLPAPIDDLFATDHAVQRSARETLGRAVAQAPPPERLRRIDRIRSGAGLHSRSWDDVRPKDVTRLVGPAGRAGHVAMLGLLTMHPSGWVRHEAVRRLTPLADGDALPFLLRRCNDWVGPIAVDAHAAVSWRLDDEHLPTLALWLPLALHTETWRRRDLDDVRGRTLDLLLVARHDGLLAAAIRTGDAARTLVRHALKHAGDHHRRVVGHGLHAADPVVRLWCVRHAPHALATDDLPGELERLFGDPIPPVRREARRVHAERFPATAARVWHEALLDRSARVRSTARFRMHRLATDARTAGRHAADHAALAGFEAADFYRRAWAAQPQRRPAVEGLAEVATAADADAFGRLLRHPVPNRRRTAVRGLVRAVGARAADDLLPLLRDANAGVVAQLRRVLPPDALAADALVEVALDAPVEFGRHFAVALLTDHGKWPSLPGLLRVAAAADPGTAALAVAASTDWLAGRRGNRVYTRPDPAQADALRTTLATHADSLPDDLATLVRADLARDATGRRRFT